MIACYYQIDTSSHNLERFRYIDTKTIWVPMTPDNLAAILPTILREFCGATVVGYAPSMESYWCKINHRGTILLHVELRILTATNTATQIAISPYIGADKIIAQFASSFEESFQLYISSPFIRASLTDSLTS